MSAATVVFRSIVFVLAVSGVARADDVVPTIDPALAPGPVPAASSRRLGWHDEWARVRPLEMIGSGVLLGGIAAFQLTDQYRPPHFTGGILFDERVRAALRAKSEAGRERAQTVGTDLYFGSIVFSIADAGVGGLVAHESGDVFEQVLLMDVEAYSITGFLQFFGADVVRRQRPYEEACAAGTTQTGCGPERTDSTKSFFAGHVAVSFTNAGLTCAHHLYLKYFDTTGDALTCAVTIASSFTVAYTRIAADKHYATDVLTGMVIGASSGFLVPTFFHYRAHPTPTDAAAPKAFRIAGVAPIASPTAVGLAVSGLF